MTLHSQHAISAGREFIETLSFEQHGSQTEYIFTFINKGQLTLQHKTAVTLSKHMFALIPAGMPHSLLDGKDLDVSWVSFCPSCLGLDENQRLMQPFRQVRLGALPVFQADNKRLPFITALLAELQQSLATANHQFLEIYKSLLLLLLHEVEQARHLEQPVSASSNKVVAALDYIQQHFLTAISLKDVAKAVHCSPSHLATLVKKETGYSIGQWIIRNRLTESCSRLLHTQTPISVMVEQLGWSDTTHFIRQFKKAYGETPAAWRKKQKSLP